MLNSLKPKSFHLHNYKTLKCLSTKTPSNYPIQDIQNILVDTTKPRNLERIVVSCLKHCSTHLSASLGRQLHALVSKFGLHSNTFVVNSLINMYLKCGHLLSAELLFRSCSNLDSVSWNIFLCGYVKNGRLVDARKLFDEMPVRDCVAYTTMVMGYKESGRWGDAVGVFKGMMEAGVLPNEVTMASVLSACSRLDGGVWSCGGMFHALVVKLGIESRVLVSTNLLNLYCLSSSVGDAGKLFCGMGEKNVVSWNVMLNGYAKAGLVDLGRELFEKMPEKDVVSWGTMVDGYIQVDRLSEGLMLYKEMVANGLGPNNVMIVNLVSACGRSRAVMEGEQIHGIIVKQGFDLHDFIQATVIAYYAACRKISYAHKQFEVSIKDHVESWNALIAGYIRNGMLDQAKQLFDEMLKRDVFTWSSMISGYTQGEQPHVALELFHEMLASGIRPNECTMVSVLSSIAALGALEEGRWAHNYIVDNSIPFNDNLSAAVIDMYAKCGSISTALEVFHQIRDRVSSVSPWNAIICGLAVHGHAKMSLEVFSDLRRHPVRPNSITFIGVLTACCHAGYVEQGRRYFTSMQDVYKIKPEMKHYGCMVDLLGRAGRLKEAEELINSMPFKADAVIWGTLLAACRTHANVDIGERAAENLERAEPSHGGARVLLSNIYADAGRWEDVFLVRRAMRSQRTVRSPGYSGVV